MKTEINQLRAQFLPLENDVATLKRKIAVEDLRQRPGVPNDAPAADRGEMLANATLAFRHLEDARMRLGKVIQAYDGGVSVYDKKGA